MKQARALLEGDAQTDIDVDRTDRGETPQKDLTEPRNGRLQRHVLSNCYISKLIVQF
jgi:hypothetical protein